MTQQPLPLSTRQQIRQQIRLRRKSLTHEQQTQAAQQAAARMMGFAPVVEAQTVAAFLSLTANWIPDR